MRIIGITGSRTITDRELIHGKLEEFVSQMEGKELLFLCGGAKGVDTIVENWARSKGHQIFHCYPYYRYYKVQPIGKGVARDALMARNKQIATQCHILLAFWDGNSHGTKATMDMAREYDVEVVDMLGQ